MSAHKLRRSVQLLSFAVFLVFLAGPVPAILKKFYLSADPLSWLSASIASRSLATGFITAMVFLLIAAIFGRFFCGYLCPMGFTIDIFDYLRKSPANKAYPHIAKLRYVLLVAVLAAAILGVNIAFHLLPISLASRFYGLVGYPIATLALYEGIGSMQEYLGLFGYASPVLKRFAMLFTTLLIFSAIFMLSGLGRRLFCRYICPTGAFLVLLSIFAPYKRRLGKGCTSCGKCARACPTAAIDKDYKDYSSADCISCKVCVDICREKSIHFGFIGARLEHHSSGLSRRTMLYGAALGGGLAMASMSELKSLLYIKHEHGDIIDPALIRPPGALLEKDFLGRCIRCGACMLICPTNGLQPYDLRSGTATLLSPVLVPERGNCEVKCNECGKVCPTGALQNLAILEKQHAKIGTARIIRERCLAWEEDKACVVCQEVCPYTAMKLDPEPGYSVSVPKVDEKKCFGCGACEFNCPLSVSAVVVEPTGELRQNTPNYTERAANEGLSLTANPKEAISDVDYSEEDELPPGFI